MMIISQVTLNRFRNFKKTTINFSSKALIFGPNDIGKSNLIYALRLLLDKNIPESFLEPQDSDFYAFDESDTYEIITNFSNIIKEPQEDECIWARCGKHISDDGNMTIKYVAMRNGVGGIKNYQLYIGPDVTSLTPLEGRSYLRAMCLEYVNSKRDLRAYIKKEQTRILQETKELRPSEEVSSDNQIENKVQTQLSAVNSTINSLSYVNRATTILNKEMCELNFDNCETIEFSAGDIDANKCISNLNLVSKINDKSVDLGGDGRSNQVYLTLWTNKNVEYSPVRECVKFYCIEEPEAHLHPHKQKGLARYLAKKLDSQIIITTHSPQIISEFPPDTFIKLYNGDGTLAAQNGCSELVDSAFREFGHRLSIIPAEAFFSDVVFLVEGVSELLFYKAFASAVEDLDLEKHNISILSVEGVGFKPYVDVFSKLNIPIVIRTDNDIFKVPKKDEYRFAGIERAVDLYNTLYPDTVITSSPERISSPSNISEEVKKNCDNIIGTLRLKNIYMSGNDLETDLANSLLRPNLLEFYQATDADLVEFMKDKKGANMYNFLAKYKNKLSSLKDSPLLTPLYKCKEVVNNG